VATFGGTLRRGADLLEGRVPSEEAMYFDMVETPASLVIMRDRFRGARVEHHENGGITVEIDLGEIRALLQHDPNEQRDYWGTEA
jgi:hypothetical protein